MSADPAAFSLPDPLPVAPFIRPVSGRAAVPGSKSITNRALILAALSDGPVTLEGALFSRDSRLLLAALQELGFAVRADEARATITVEGQGGIIPAAEASLTVGNAGTVARFLPALLALREGGTYQLDGDAAMRKRPIRGLLDALTAQGATVTYHDREGFFPFTLKTVGLKGGQVRLDAAASSQLLSALLMAAPFARQPLQVALAGETVSQPFVTMTLAMMRQFGVEADAEGDAYAVPCGAYRLPSRRYAVEPDATAASYFLALPLAVEGTVEVPGLSPNMLQGDIGFTTLLRRLGLRITEKGEGLVASYAGGSGSAKGLDEDMGPISDTFLTLAALAPLLNGQTRISGIAHTRRQETDRVAAMAAELKKLGQHVKETEDTLTITPDYSALRRAGAAGAQVHTYEDHRIAMSFAILGSHNLLGSGMSWLRIEDPACCAKTFPHFFSVLDELRAHRSA